MVDSVYIDDRAFKHWIQEAAKRGKDLRPWFRGALDQGVSQMLRKHFDSKGVYGGEPWAPLRPSTKQHRIRRGANRGGVDHPLWDTARLRGSLLRPSHPEAIRDIGKYTYRRGTNVPYALFHQEGYMIQAWGNSFFYAPVRVPARVLIPEPPSKDLMAWEKSLAKYVESGRGK